jgi:hypothetical protein
MFAVAAPAMAVDTTAPSATSLSVQGIAGGDPGYIKQGARAYVCANGVTDTGAPPSGVKDVKTDITSFGLPKMGYDLANFPMSQDYNYYCPDPSDFNAWEADWLVKNPLPEGVYPFSVTMTDNANNSSTQSSTVIVDNTPPKGTNIQSVNGGATVGKAELGDKLNYTFNEVMNKFLAGDTPRPVVVRIDNSGSNDKLTIWNTSNTALANCLGTVQLGGDYVSANRTFGATGTKSTLVRSGSQVTLKLGTPSGTTNTVTGSRTLVWSVSGGTDRAGNPVTPATLSEPGPGDPDF